MCPWYCSLLLRLPLIPVDLLIPSTCWSCLSCWFLFWSRWTCCARRPSDLLLPWPVENPRTCEPVWTCWSRCSRCSCGTCFTPVGPVEPLNRCSRWPGCSCWTCHSCLNHVLRRTWTRAPVNCHSCWTWPVLRYSCYSVIAGRCPLDMLLPLFPVAPVWACCSRWSCWTCVLLLPVCSRCSCCSRRTCLNPSACCSCWTRWSCCFPLLPCSLGPVWTCRSGGPVEPVGSVGSRCSVGPCAPCCSRCSVDLLLPSTCWTCRSGWTRWTPLILLNGCSRWNLLTHGLLDLWTKLRDWSHHNFKTTRIQHVTHFGYYNYNIHLYYWAMKTCYSFFKIQSYSTSLRN